MRAKESFAIPFEQQAYSDLAIRSSKQTSLRPAHVNCKAEPGQRERKRKRGNVEGDSV